MPEAAAFASAGGLEFELMQLLDDGGPNMWREALSQPFERDALHHFCIWPDDYEASLADAMSRGFTVVQDGGTPSGRFVYLSQPGGGDHLLEITESTPRRRAFQKLVADAAGGWDGIDPVRTEWHLSET